MEAPGWRNSISSSNGGADDSTGGHNKNTNNAWDHDINGRRYNNDYISNSRSVTQEASVVHTHMMCNLELGKRHYCDLPEAAAQSSTGRRNKPLYYVSPGVSRCQVEGCHVALGNAKEYYRKHKVCEFHSKAPRVLVSGLEKRFCQQCSRFHGMTEFDESKRSCRRRLKGHNQRRRKGTHLVTVRRPASSASGGCAPSLLSSGPEWNNSSGDLSSRCSAALYELIMANRATSVLGHHQNGYQYHQSTASASAPALEFGLMSMKERSKDPDQEWTDYSWFSFGEANVM